MLPAEERGVRRSIAFSELLQHPNLVRLMGTWESDEHIFVGEWMRDARLLLIRQPGCPRV